jgi:hypothetical protein
MAESSLPSQFKNNQKRRYSATVMAVKKKALHLIQHQYLDAHVPLVIADIKMLALIHHQQIDGDHQHDQASEFKVSVGWVHNFVNYTRSN